MTSFANKKRLRFIITLGVNKFGSSNDNVIIIEGMRATAEVDKVGGLQLSSLSARIYGVSESDMKAITVLRWTPNYLIKSQIEVYAIDGRQESLVFAGDIVTAQADYQSMPDVFLSIQAAGQYNAMLQAVDPISLKGGAPVSVVMEKIAQELGLSFQSHGVDGVLIDPYYDGDLINRARRIAQDADIELVIDDKTLTILPRNSSIPGLEPLISPSTGLVGYPIFDGTGVVFRCLYNPAIVFKGAVQLETSAPNASGRWIVDSVGAFLESEKPGGAWFSYVRGSLHGQAFTK